MLFYLKEETDIYFIEYINICYKKSKGKSKKGRINGIKEQAVGEENRVREEGDRGKGRGWERLGWGWVGDGAGEVAVSVGCGGAGE